MSKSNRVAVVPDLNINEQIEGISQTVGAYAGATVTALVGGIMTGLNGLFRGAVAGGQATYGNTGHQQVAVQNTAGQAASTPTIAPIAEITDEELALIQQLRAKRSLEPVANGH